MHWIVPKRATKSKNWTSAGLKGETGVAVELVKLTERKLLAWVLYFIFQRKIILPTRVGRGEYLKHTFYRCLGLHFVTSYAWSQLQMTLFSGWISAHEFVDVCNGRHAVGILYMRVLDPWSTEWDLPGTFFRKGISIPSHWHMLLYRAQNSVGSFVIPTP